MRVRASVSRLLHSYCDGYAISEKIREEYFVYRGWRLNQFYFVHFTIFDDDTQTGFEPPAHLGGVVSGTIEHNIQPRRFDVLYALFACAVDAAGSQSRLHSVQFVGYAFFFDLSLTDSVCQFAACQCARLVQINQPASIPLFFVNYHFSLKICDSLILIAANA